MFGRKSKAWREYSALGAEYVRVCNERDAYKGMWEDATRAMWEARNMYTEAETMADTWQRIADSYKHEANVASWENDALRALVTIDKAENDYYAAMSAEAQYSDTEECGGVACYCGTCLPF